MADLNFPVPEKPLPGPPVLSMDEYWAYVQFHLRYTYDRKDDEKQRQKQKVSVPFRLESGKRNA